MQNLRRRQESLPSRAAKADKTTAANARAALISPPRRLLESRSKGADDLIIIEGIGPKIAELLKADGITDVR